MLIYKQKWLVLKVAPPALALDSDRKEMKPNQNIENKYTIYHVRSGDTLSRIAKRFYNDPSRWEEIIKQTGFPSISFRYSSGPDVGDSKINESI